MKNSLAKEVCEALREFKAGDKVRLSPAGINSLKRTRSYQHIREFGKSTGRVIGPTNWGQGISGPEVDVRWECGNKFAYQVNHLEFA